jgi:hypothetical protein
MNLEQTLRQNPKLNHQVPILILQIFQKQILLKNTLRTSQFTILHQN